MGSLSRLGQVKLADHFTTIQTAKSWLGLINLNFIHRKSINLGENLGILGIVSPLYKSSIRTDVKEGGEGQAKFLTTIVACSFTFSSV